MLYDISKKEEGIFTYLSRGVVLTLTIFGYIIYIIVKYAVVWRKKCKFRRGKR